NAPAMPAILGDGRRHGCRIVGRVHPVVAGERIAELLEFPDGCNALFVDGAHGSRPVRPAYGEVQLTRSRGREFGVPFRSRNELKDLASTLVWYRSTWPTSTRCPLSKLSPPAPSAQRACVARAELQQARMGSYRAVPGTPPAEPRRDVR